MDVRSERTHKAGLALDTKGHSLSLNGYRAMLPISLPTNDEEVNGIVFKVPDRTWGVGQDYGEGNMLMMLSDALNTVPAPAAQLKAITGITNASPPVVTSVAHGWLTGDIVRITATTKVAYDNLFWMVDKITNDTYTLNYAIGDPGPAPGSAGAVGYAYGDRNAIIQRLSDGGLGTQGIHVASGLRGRVGQSISGGIGIDIDPSHDILGILVRNPTTGEWVPTPTGSFIIAQDTRGAGGARSVFDVMADGTVSLRPKEGRAATDVLFRTRNDGDSANALEIRNNGGLWASGISSFGGSAPIAGISVLIKSPADATIALLLAGNSSSQTAPLLQWSDPTGGVVYGSIIPSGQITTKKIAAPADADLIANVLAWWHDNTVGGAGPMFRGKDSAGTAYTIDLSKFPANADTAGATLAALETEVNQIKQQLRDRGLMA